MQKILITPTEAVTLADFVNTVNFLEVDNLCKSIVYNANKVTKNDRKYYSMWIFNAIFNAGRVQGIREERSGRK